MYFLLIAYIRRTVLRYRASRTQVTKGAHGSFDAEEVWLVGHEPSQLPGGDGIRAGTSATETVQGFVGSHFTAIDAARGRQKCPPASDRP